jgi:hypothetical protein
MIDDELRNCVGSNYAKIKLPIGTDKKMKNTKLASVSAKF